MRSAVALVALALLLVAAPAAQASPLPVPGDADGDALPDDAEPVLCQADNTFLGSDGSCTGEGWGDYHWPTRQGIGHDYAFLVDGTLCVALTPACEVVPPPHPW